MAAPSTIYKALATSGKMYNGNVGLKTPRGSGTSGYVQRNLSFVAPKPQNTAYNYNQDVLGDGRVNRVRKPNNDVLLHRSKREIEIECLEYREELEGEGKVSRGEIDELVADLRARLMKRLDERVERMQDGAIKVAKDKELERMRDAFQIDPNQKETKAFDFEGDKKRQERMSRSEEQRRQEAILRLQGIKPDKKH